MNAATHTENQENKPPVIQAPLVIANWKMHGLSEKTRGTLTNVILQYAEHPNIVICPPFTALRPVGNALENTSMHLGAQNCHWEDEGAYTGDISALMLSQLGCDFVIVGHSERRQYHHEDDALVRKKASSALRHGIVPIICVGESEAERAAGKTLEKIQSQLKGCIPAESTPENTVIAYEPVWAIGSGKTPTMDEIREAHDTINLFTQTKNLAWGKPIASVYGGSVKAANVRQILGIDSVSGVLVGGASMDAVEFCSILEIAVLIRERRLADKAREDKKK